MVAKKKIVNKVGPWVTGGEFWDREGEIKRLTELLDQGENILLVAPRRVGKTSLLRETLRRADVRGKDYGLFVDVQDCSTPEEVIVAISMETRRFQGLWAKTVDVFRNTLGELTQTIESVGNDLINLKLREGVAGDWRAKGDRILEELSKADKPVILCLDELPVMVNRLLHKEGEPVPTRCRQSTEVFLSWLRRSAGNYQSRIRFVICGSIGLEPVVRRFGLSSTIAHLHPYHLAPWDRKTADECLEALAASYVIALSGELRSLMLDEIGCCIPHHVQMYFSHVLDDCRSRACLAPTRDDISRVYRDFMLGTRGHAELADYEERLLRVLGSELKPLALELLTETAVAGILTPEAARIIGMELRLAEEDALRSVLDVLEHDGYLRRMGDEGGSYEFVSKLVREWWQRRFSFGYIVAAQRKG